MARAVAIIGDSRLRAAVVELLDYAGGFEVAEYSRARDWPFLGEILGGRCWRMGRCGADVLVVDAAPDTLMSGPQLLLHQRAQGCLCAAGASPNKAALLPPAHPQIEALRAAKVEVFTTEPGTDFTAWARNLPTSPTGPTAPQPIGQIERALYMRCPYTQQVLPADSLKRLQSHFHVLGHIITMKQVLKLREANWCDEEGNPVDLAGEELERLRLTTE